MMETEEEAGTREDAAAETWRERLGREILHPRRATLIGFALAVMIAAAWWTAGRMADDAGPGAPPVAPPGATP